jgi:O-antigen/teichoic acid export membrane protein
MSNDPIINNSDQQDLDLQPSDVQLENNQEGMGAGYQSSNKRIAKNTLLLYLRMIVMMLIGLYTSRVILQVLGVKDYGLYNAVGGVVTMLTVLTSALTTAINRYLTFELGKGDIEKLKRVFSTSLNVLVILAIIIVLIGFLLGGWFLHHKMNIPAGRMDAANWVLYCTLLSFAVGLINIPYNSSIISHERMNVFAYMTILDVTLKLLIVYALYLSPFDKLKTYAVLALMVAVFIRFIYATYCKKNFQECTYQLTIDKPLLKEMTGFVGWNFLGNSAWIFNNQGINILINIYFGVTLNAARGIATQVEGLTMRFVNSFMTALLPQITKSYAAGELSQMHQLVCRGAKFSFFLVLFFAIPICFETNHILYLWLGKVPDYAVTFVRMTFLSTLCTVLGYTLVTAQLATGNIKKYQIVMTLCGLWVFPLTWLAYKLGGDAVWAYIIFFITYFVLIFVRIYLVKDLIHMPWILYIKDVLLICATVLLLAVIPPLAIYLLIPSSLLRLFLLCFVSFLSSGLVMYWVGLRTEERQMVNGLAVKFIAKLKRK